MTISDIARTRSLTQSGGWRMPGGLLGTALRYGVSAAGPVAVSGAHFLASFIFLRSLPAREFGLFSFVMVLVSFGMSEGSRIQGLARPRGGCSTRQSAAAAHRRAHISATPALICKGRSR